MWVRKRIDIRPSDLLFGMRACMRRHRRAELERRLENIWKLEQTLACLSVRSGFELLLSNVKWSPGSEILMSGMTIPHMPQIVRKNNFVPVALDLDVRNLSVSADQIRAKITPRTKAIVVAHLFGGLCDLQPVFEVAKEHNLLVIEDCAQAYVGSEYLGDERADISMFSFGAIKTNTSLCGAMFVVRHASLLVRLKQAHEQWPVQSRWTMMKRLIKYCQVKAISTYYVSGTIARGLRMIGRNHDSLAVKLSRGFSGGDFFQRIRQQPSDALLSLMERRFNAFQRRDIVQRTKRGHKLEKALRPSVQVLGSDMDRQTYWVMPILVDNRDELVSHLWKLGFDATRSCSMQPVNRLDEPGASNSGKDESGKDESGKDESDSNSDLETSELKNIRFILDHIVFLPFDLSISPGELKKMAQAIIAFQPTKITLPPAPTPASFSDDARLLPSDNWRM